MVDTSKYKDNKAVASTLELKRAMNTMNFIFRKHPQKYAKMKDVKEFLLKPADGELSTLTRKVELLTKASLMDPFMELMGFIRDKEFIEK